MTDNRHFAARAIDKALEVSIVGSFTKLGYRARSAAFDWEPVTTDLTGQVAVVTGATSGIGRETARQLCALGAEVHVTSRSAERASEAAASIAKETGGDAVGHPLDTGEFVSVHHLVDELTASGDGVDILINNAGALTDEYATDDRGMELTLSTHLVGPYLLMTELRDHLRPGARVLWMSSGGMYTQGLDVDDIEMTRSSYRGAIAYARAKRGQVEMVTHLAPIWAPEVVLHTVHPGWVATPGVDAGLPGFGKVMGPLLRSAEQGADTMVWLASGGAAGAEPGQFWLDRRPRGTAYLPGTGATAADRERLVNWLELQVLPGKIG